MARLGGGVDDELGLDLLEDLFDALAVADVLLDVGEFFAGGLEALAVPGGVALGAEELGAHVVIDAPDGEAEVVEKGDGFGADETA